MNITYLEKIKEENSWFWDLDKKYYLVVTDDLDSLLSALLILQYRPNWEIGWFYDFRDGLYEKQGISANITDDNVIGVDLSHPKMKCVSNHLTVIRNERSNKHDINMNIIDNIHMKRSIYDYHNKYNLNTLLLVYALLELKPESTSEMATLLLPDSAFLGYFADKDYKDHWVQKKYLKEIFELDEIWELQNEVGDIQRFKNGQANLGMCSKIWVTDKGIETVDEDVRLEDICDILRIDRSILNELYGDYWLIERHKNYSGSTYADYDTTNMFSFAVVNKYNVVYSKKIN